MLKETSQGDVSFTHPKHMLDGEKKTDDNHFGDYIFYAYLRIIRTIDNSK